MTKQTARNTNTEIRYQKQTTRNIQTHNYKYTANNRQPETDKKPTTNTDALTLTEAVNDGVKSWTSKKISNAKTFSCSLHCAVCKSSFEIQSKIN